MITIGKSAQITGIDICGYNPTKEDFRTGKFISSMIYHLVLGSSLN